MRRTNAVRSVSPAQSRRALSRSIRPLCPSADDGMNQGTGTPRIVTGPSVGLSSAAWSTPGGVITSIAFGTVFGSVTQIGAVPPSEHTPNVKSPAVDVNPRAWSPLKPSCPVSTTVNDHPVVGEPNALSGTATVIVFVIVDETTALTVPCALPAALTQTGDANPCISSRWLHASADAIE